MLFLFLLISIISLLPYDYYSPWTLNTAVIKVYSLLLCVLGDDELVMRVHVLVGEGHAQVPEVMCAYRLSADLPPHGSDPPTSRQ